MAGKDVHQLVKSRVEKNLHEGEWDCWEDRVTGFFFPGLESIMRKVILEPRTEGRVLAM